MSAFKKIWLLILFLFFIFVNVSAILPNEKENFFLPEDTITLLFSGDTHFVWGIQDIQKKGGLLSPISIIKPIFYQYDFRVLNLETVIAKEGISKNQVNYVFKSEPENLQLLKELKIDLVSLANNHAFDLEETGLIHTLQYLKQYDIPYVGAGLNLKESITPYIVNIKNIRFAFYSLSLVGSSDDFATSIKPGIAGYNNLLLQSIEEIKNKIDYIFFLIHWGYEYDPFINEQQKKIAEILWKKGVHFIIGHHPHIPQAIIVKNNRAIVYSLGNFLFGSSEYLQNHNIIAVFHFEKNTKKFIGIELLSITGKYRENGYQVKIPEEEERLQLFKELYYLSLKEYPEQKIFISSNKRSLFIKEQDL